MRKNNTAKRVLKPERAYSRGAALERRVKAKLEALGWSVTRAAGSKGRVDLVAVRSAQGHERWGVLTTRAVYVQVKRDGQISPRERLDLATEAKKAGAECFVVTGDYWVREVSDWHGRDWESLSEVF